jgi:hypothetical protein
LKVLLVVIRQTFGWLDKRTGKRKERDRISSSQFQRKTGLSQRIITRTIHSLSIKKLISITGTKHDELKFACDRKGKRYLYYALIQPVHFETATSVQCAKQPAHNVTYNKTNSFKPTSTKRTFSGHISSLIQNRAYSR